MNDNGYVLVTGASSGMGLEFAKIFARRGYDLVLVARTEQALEIARDEIQKSGSVRVRIFPGDLKDMENVKFLFSYLGKEKIAPKILINNAGFANFGRFWEVDITQQMELVDVNMKSLTLMTRLFLDQLPNDQGMRILNVSSMAGLIPGPFISVYAASKAYVYWFSQSLASELKSPGIQVSVFCPGDVKTNFYQRAGMGDLKVKLKLIDPTIIVEKAVHEFMAGKRVIIPQVEMRFLRFFLGLFSDAAVADKMVRQRKRW